MHVRRAREGDDASLTWLVERFTPVLLAQARFRMGPALVREVDPEDLVQHVWAVALPALPALEARGGRETPVLVRFLATTLLYRVNELTRRAIRRRGTDASRAEGLSRLPDASAGVVSRVVRSEASAALVRCIESLPEADRRVLVLRAFEQVSNQRVAELTGATPNAVSLRYNRALEELRRRLPGSIVEELAAPDPDAASGAP